MDNQKDIAKGQIGLSLSDVSDSFVFERTEKLTTALYRITDFVSDIEPLKWELRRRAGELLSSVLLNYRPTGHVLEEASRLADTLASLCRVACTADNFSTMNFSLLRDEYSVLRDLLKTEMEKKVAGPHQAVKDLLIHTEKPLLRMIEDPQQFFGLNELSFRGQNREDLKNGSVTKMAKITDHKKDEAAFPNPRREQILAYLAASGKSTIKDIAQSVPGCSEKTIQRELASLVRAGVLKREGERRWTTYSRSN